MTAAERIIPRLDGVRSAGDGKWVARCPAHDDRRPSLSVRAVDGRLLVYCWAGCRVEDIAAALGLTVGQLFDDVWPRRPDPDLDQRRRAAARLQSWYDSEVERVTIELRTRDTLAQSVTDAVRNGTITEDEAWDHLAIAYTGRAELEHYFERLRTEPPLQLWREWKAAVRRANVSA